MKRLPPRQFHCVLALLLWALLPGNAGGGTIYDTQISHSQGQYYVSFDVWIARDAAQIRNIVMDYPGWEHLSDMVQGVEVLPRAQGEAARIRMTLRMCLMLYCRNVVKVQQITLEGPDKLHAALVPHADNNFRMAQEHWRIVAEKNGTRVQYRAHLQPDFFVPPVIGPLLIKSMIRKELKSAVTRLEQLSKTP